MTPRDFASKYGLPLTQVKAALQIPKGDIRTVKKFNEKMHMDYNEGKLIVDMTAYYMEDMRFCIERAHKDNEMLKKLSDGFKELTE